MSLKLNTASGGSITLQEADTASNLTLTVPAQAGSIVTADSSGNVGIGTASPQRKTTIYDASFPCLQFTNSSTGTTLNDGLLVFQSGANATVSNQESGYLSFETNNTERMRINADGGLRTQVTGGGSLMETFGCRAWVNFNGTGTVAIRASGNVSSITDNGTGNYNVNFTTAMPDANYCTNVTAQNTVSSDYGNVDSSGVATSFARVNTYRRDTGNVADCNGVFVSVFR